MALDVVAGVCEHVLNSLICTILLFNVLLLQVNLHTLDLAENKITRISNVSKLTKLEEFWVSKLGKVVFWVQHYQDINGT